MTPYLTSSALNGVPHGFFTRQGGVSRGEFASLNCGTGSNDAPELVARNRRIAADALIPGAALCGVYQVHGRQCAMLDTPWAEADRPQADALVTATRGVLLAILTADCVPVLFADATAGVVGAAHAGWKGALAGITDATLDAMEAKGASRAHIRAAIGPCIGRASYEVDLDFRTRFCDVDGENARFFQDGRTGHAHFDIAAYVAARLADAGVRQIDILGRDTCAEPAHFFSYRRACLNGENIYGRQISLIGVEP